jgi:hypothetical protein
MIVNFFSHFTFIIRMCMLNSFLWYMRDVIAYADYIPTFMVIQE